MILTFSKRSVSDAVLTRHGDPLYYVFTSGFTTEIKKRDQSTQKTISMACIEYDAFSTITLVRLWGERVIIDDRKFFSLSRTFISSDTNKYKWKVKLGSKLKLVTVGRIDREVVATFERGSAGKFFQSRPMSVTITDKYLHLLDEIVTTLIYITLELRRQDKPPE